MNFKAFKNTPLHWATRVSTLARGRICGQGLGMRKTTTSTNGALACLAFFLFASGVSQSAEPAAAPPGAPQRRGGRGPGNSNDVFYRLGPDSKPMDGVPKGKFAGVKIISSTVFPGTQHTYDVY